MPPRPTHQARAMLPAGHRDRPRLWLLCSCRVSITTRDLVQRQVKNKGGPETRTVCTRTNSLGSYWARHSCQTYSVRTEAARTLPPLGLARNSHEARQGA